MDMAYETAVIFLFSAVIMCATAVTALRGADKMSGQMIIILSPDNGEHIELLLRSLAAAEDCEIIVCCDDENSETAEICRRFFRDRGIPRLCAVCTSDMQ